MDVEFEDGNKDRVCKVTPKKIQGDGSELTEFESDPVLSDKVYRYKGFWIDEYSSGRCVISGFEENFSSLDEAESFIDSLSPAPSN